MTIDMAVTKAISIVDTLISLNSAHIPLKRGSQLSGLYSLSGFNSNL